MPLFVSSRYLLSIATAVLCLTSSFSHAKIVVEDNFIDEATRENLLAQLPSEMHRFKQTVDLPGKVYKRLLSVLHPENSEVFPSQLTAPARGQKGMVAAHKDTFEDSSSADKQVGLVYLEGDGRMQLKNDLTGEETIIDVKPGRFLSWDNRHYTHQLLAGSMPRRILGPMAFRDGGFQSIGDIGSPEEPIRFIIQARAHNLFARAGRMVRVTADLVVLDDQPTGRKRAVRALETDDIAFAVSDQNLRKKERERIASVKVLD
jgi:hypothetical protein